MKIYIVTDMEGVSGICHESQVQPGTQAYEAARHLLAGDVNAAISGAFEGGATEVVVSDGHWAGANFLMEEMDARALYERPNGDFDLMPGLDESFAGVFCIGHHAMAGTINAFLDHTQSSAKWFSYSINGRTMGELGQIGVWAGGLGVPVLFVTGDQATCREASDFFPDVETVAVKVAIGRQHARCIHPTVAQVAIRDAAHRSLSLVGRTSPFKMDFPLKVRLEFVLSSMADEVAKRPGILRIDARTVERTANNPREITFF